MGSSRVFEFVFIAFLVAAASVQNHVDAKTSPCARALLVVAHPDDETLFAGELLLGRAAALPGGCRRAAWHVVCATRIQDRRKSFDLALTVARNNGLAASITWEMWDFHDCNNIECGAFEQPGPPLADRLVALLVSDRWDFIVSHNPNGEYGHQQHIGLNKIVSRVFTQGKSLFGPNLRFLIFDPLPEVNTSTTPGKWRMLRSYTQGRPSPARLKLFATLRRHSEHSLEAHRWLRPMPLYLGYMMGAVVENALHFSYWWSFVEEGKWGKLGPFKARRARVIVESFLRETEQESCGHKAVDVPVYPLVCTALGRSRSSDDPLALPALLRAMERQLGPVTPVSKPA